MRITFVLPHAGLAGGIRVAAIYAQALADRGHTVHVVSTPRRQPGTKAKIVGLLKGKGWPQAPAKVAGHMDRVSVPHHVIDRFRPMTDADVPDADVVIATWWETAEWVAGFSPSKGKKVYFIQHDETHANQPIARVEATWKLPMYRIVVAQWLADIGRQRYGADQVRLVANGVDPVQFSAPPREKQKTPTVGLMYSTTPFKGVDVALEAFAIAARNITGLKLIAFGQQEISDKLPLPPGTKYERQPAQDRLKDVYAGCDAWLFASRSEGFGLPILEAMACRTPVIGTPTGAAPELIGEGGGVLVKPQDPMDLARAIERTCRLPAADWKALSDAAHATAQRHTWEKASREFEATLIDAAR